MKRLTSGVVAGPALSVRLPNCRNADRAPANRCRSPDEILRAPSLGAAATASPVSPRLPGIPIAHRSLSPSGLREAFIQIPAMWMARHYRRLPSMTVLTGNTVEAPRQASRSGTSRQHSSLVGQCVAEYPRHRQAHGQEGHEVANHSWSARLRLRRLGADGVRKQMENTNDAIRRACRSHPTAHDRPPYGATSNTLNKRFTEDYGMKVILWSVGSPGLEKSCSPMSITRSSRMPIRVHIILAHDIHATTVAAMPEDLSTPSCPREESCHRFRTHRHGPPWCW